jgi:hypothetical protein
MAAPRQRMPAARPLPVAADTRRLRQCPRWTAPSGHRPPFRQRRGHQAPRQPSGRPHRIPPQATVDSTADRPATADRRRTLRPSARRLRSPDRHAGSSALRSPTLVNRPGRRNTGGHQRPVGAGHRRCLPDTPQFLGPPGAAAARRRRLGAAGAAAAGSGPDSGPPAVSAAITTGGQGSAPRAVPSAGRGRAATSDSERHCRTDR